MKLPENLQKLQVTSTAVYSYIGMKTPITLPINLMAKYGKVHIKLEHEVSAEWLQMLY